MVGAGRGNISLFVGMSGTGVPGGEEEDPPNYLVLGLAVGIPCGVFIVVLLFLIGAMVIFTIYSSRYVSESC